ncbi:phosphoglycerate mutase family domain-containing protein [Emericellopsis cladophorae]|uniref:Phosphoglycerate mutase family domain-containing protein n=1 Tax=Emericellopsis cladophorae TaxID=2686198 RepID=A0A9P9Y8P1_9HYPO|nr:phosphoglycerate mutase family domain-containing protein [Emericellopsis cladophorae]KAI6785403.1 phosphoglycerate mutase family domain-containing protein [Emericellopsis cladophorae]
MAKPRLIILVRHAQSEGNSEDSIPDHRVKLTPEGQTQAREAGRRLRELLRPTDTLHFFTSPYRRTRETTEGILETLTSDEDSPSPFRRANIKVYEEPRLREQDFGNFQPCSAEMERMWQERADYGHFFYRIPNGESAADAYDRISGFNESLWRQFGEDDFASVCVLVTHGLMSRVFLMKWYHFSVEYFEDLRNVNHCEFLIMRRHDNGKYLLENNLRTWSDLRRERALKEAREAKAPEPDTSMVVTKKEDDHRPKKEDDGPEKEDDGLERERAPVTSSTTLARSKTFTVTRRWGGCPNGCNHSSHYLKRREDLELLRQRDVEHANATTDKTWTRTTVSDWRRTLSSDEEDDTPAKGPSPLVRMVTTTTEDSDSSSQRHTPTSLLDPATARALHVGRDGGGTYSGHASTAGSDTDDISEDEHRRFQRTRRIPSLNTRIRIANAESVARGEVMRLGDAPSISAPEDELGREEQEDRSIRGSVF